MRIISGQCKGLSLKSPTGAITRPTSDRLRQTIFDILCHGDLARDYPLCTLHVLDIFAGTGALGLEALSRGALTSCFIENNPAALRCIRQNIRACHMSNKGFILPIDITVPYINPFPYRFNLLFADPPYESNLVVPSFLLLQENNWLAQNLIFIIETGAKENVILQYMKIFIDRIQGTSRIRIFTR